MHAELSRHESDCVRNVGRQQRFRQTDQRSSQLNNKYIPLLYMVNQENNRHTERERGWDRRSCVCVGVSVGVWVGGAKKHIMTDTEWGLAWGLTLNCKHCHHCLLKIVHTVKKKKSVLFRTSIYCQMCLCLETLGENESSVKRELWLTCSPEFLDQILNFLFISTLTAWMTNLWLINLKLHCCL